MNTQLAKAEYRMSKWAQVIKERQDCSQTVKEFCEDRGISEHAYYYWLRKLRDAACKEFPGSHESANSTPSGWVQISPAPESKDILKIEAGGCHISVNAATDLELLKKVCRILRAL